MSTVTQYDIGDELRISVRFYDNLEVDRDPTTVVFKIKDPSGALTTYTFGTDAEVVRDTTGRYHFDLTIAANGVYRYRWEGTGAVVTAEESQIHVRRSCFS